MDIVNDSLVNSRTYAEKRNDLPELFLYELSASQTQQYDNTIEADEHADDPN